MTQKPAQPQRSERQKNKGLTPDGRRDAMTPLWESDADQKKMERYLRRMVDKEDLCMASHVLPADHPIRPALKAAIAPRKKKR